MTALMHDLALQVPGIAIYYSSKTVHQNVKNTGGDNEQCLHVLGRPAGGFSSRVDGILAARRFTAVNKIW